MDAILEAFIHLEMSNVLYYVYSHLELIIYRNDVGRDLQIARDAAVEPFVYNEMSKRRIEDRRNW